MTIMQIVQIALFLLFVSCKSEKKNLDELASRYHRVGIDLAQAESFDLSLAYFRAASRIKPDDVILLNDLAVTEMRLKYYEQAKRRLTRAIRLGSALAVKNMEQLQSVMGEPEVFNITTDLSALFYLKSTQAIKTVSLPDLKKINGLEQGSWLREPLIVRNASTRLGMDLRALAIETLAASKEYDSEDVDFYPHNILRESSKPLHATLGNAIRQLMTIPDHVYANLDASEPGTYVFWNLGDHVLSSSSRDSNTTNLQSFLPSLVGGAFGDWVSEFGTTAATVEDRAQLGSFLFNNQWLLFNMGEKGSGTYFHKDTMWTSSLHLQTQGETKWHLCAPSETIYMHGSEAWMGGELDAFNPDYKRFPDFKHANCFQDTLNAGDILIVPPHYWRQTFNLKRLTGFLSLLLVEPGSVDGLILSLKSRMCDISRTFADHKNCLLLEKIARVWVEKFMTQDMKTDVEREGQVLGGGETRTKAQSPLLRKQRQLDVVFRENAWLESPRESETESSEDARSNFNPCEDGTEHVLLDFDDAYF